MRQTHFRPGATWPSMLSILSFVVFAWGSARALDLSDNLSKATSGTESSTVSRWLAASFRTDSSGANHLTSVTLLLANTEPGTAALELYSDAGLEPADLVATLTSPESYSSTPEPAIFTASGPALESGTTYWLVLRAISGAFAWAWTADNTGAGAGFQTAWDSSEESGAAWFAQDVYPLQLKVTVSTTDPIVDCNSNGISDSIDLQNGTSRDCNTNEKLDECDISSGISADLNLNGLPDECEPTFLRGDANCDARTDISDSVWTLNYLFVGGLKPCCGDAADVNDDGKLDLSDPIRALNYLFQGESPPPAPGPVLPCGIDLTSDGLEESLPCDYPKAACVGQPVGE